MKVNRYMLCGQKNLHCSTIYVKGNRYMLCDYMNIHCSTIYVKGNRYMLCGQMNMYCCSTNNVKENIYTVVQSESGVLRRKHKFNTQKFHF